MKLKNVLICVTCIFVISFISCTSTMLTPIKSDDTIRVITFNVRYDNPSDGNNKWSNRKANVVNLVKFYDADILGTQEVLKSQKDYLDINLPEYSSVGIGRTDGKNAGEFSAIFFKKNKFRQIDSGTFWLSPTPDSIASIGWDAALERICTWAELEDKTNDEFFFVFNTHFDHIGEQARVKSAELILTKINEMTNGMPVVLTGDFNFSDSSDGYKMITTGDKYKMYDARYKSLLPNHGPTWTFHGFESVEMNKREKIDFIFVSNKISVYKHGVLSDRYDGGYPSDHLPVLADIMIK